MFPGNFLYPRNALRQPASAIRRAAAKSTSLVVMPGESMDEISLRIWLASRQAARMYSTSCRVLMGIILNQSPNIGENSLDVTSSLDLDQQASIILVDRDRFFPVRLQPSLQSFMVIVRSLLQPSAAIWARVTRRLDVPAHAHHFAAVGAN